jgi:cytochrome c5
MKSLILTFSLLFFNLQGQAYSHQPEKVIEQAHKGKTGEALYFHYCANCHHQPAKIELGAPKFRNKTHWQARLAKPKGTVMTNLLEGLNMMPARGGCFECSDKDLMEALNYMLPKKKS